MTIAEIIAVALGLVTLTGAFVSWSIRQGKEFLDKFNKLVASVHDIKIALLGGIGNPGIAKRIEFLEEGQDQLRFGQDRMGNRLDDIETRLETIEAQRADNGRA